MIANTNFEATLRYVIQDVTHKTTELKVSELTELCSKWRGGWCLDLPEADLRC